jgi:surface antigen
VSSCDKDEVENVPTSIGESTVDSNQPILRASSLITATASPGEALQGSSFSFSLAGPTTLLSASGVVVYLRFTAPSGQIVEQSMPVTGTLGGTTMCSHTRTLSQYGKYYVDFGYKLNNGSFQTFIGDLRSVVVLHPEIPQVDDYPFSNGNNTQSDNWGFKQRWCTSWVAWSINQMWGTTSAFHNNTMGINRIGNAEEWKSHLMSLGYEADNTPRVGDIAWWNTSTVKHVAFVNKVQSNGTITITEYNGTNPFAYSSRTVSTSQNYPTSFIHVQTKRQ